MSNYDKKYHLQGKMHKKNVKLQSKPAESSNKNKILTAKSSKIYHCNVCETTMSNYDKQYHLQGQRHKKNAKLQLEPAKSSNKSDKNKISNAKPSNMYCCNVCELPLHTFDFLFK
eukprot:451626_1